jgi:hypothetical protein
MSFSKGLTTWCVRIGATRALMWRWNMPLREALRTGRMKTYGHHGYLTAGPLIVQW